MTVNKIKFEWFGQIPEEWKVSKIKFMHTKTRNSFTDGDWIESTEIVDKGIRYITTGNIGEGKFKYQGRGFITKETFERLNCTEIFEGDLLFSRLSPPVGRSCILPNLSSRVITSVDNVVIRLKEEYLKEFYNFLFNSVLYFEHTDTLSRGSTLTRISRNILGNIKVLVPPLSEQKLISKYLDKKTKKIDSLIEKIEKKIEFLKEQKTVLINQYVTKGFDENVEMKDSGVEWIGEIPKHWNKIKINYIVDVRDGTHDTPVYLDDKNGFPLVTQKDIYGGILDFSKTRYISCNDHELISKRSKVLRNDIVMSMIGSIGFPTIVDTDKEFSIKNLALFKTSNSSENTEFIKFALESKYINSQLELEKGGGVQNFVSLETLRNLKIFIPSIAEQNRIVIFLKEKINRIQKLIDYELKRNELIKEYRQSLISSLVTGKIRITENMI